MKVIPIEPHGTEKSETENAEASGTQSFQIILTEDEKAILLKACKTYRQTIPLYIQSRQPEIHLIDAIILKLS